SGAADPQRVVGKHPVDHPLGVANGIGVVLLEVELDNVFSRIRIDVSAKNTDAGPGSAGRVVEAGGGRRCGRASQCAHQQNREKKSVHQCHLLRVKTRGTQRLLQNPLARFKGRTRSLRDAHSHTVVWSKTFARSYGDLRNEPAAKSTVTELSRFAAPTAGAGP